MKTFHDEYMKGLVDFLNYTNWVFMNSYSLVNPFPNLYSSYVDYCKINAISCIMKKKKFKATLKNIQEKINQEVYCIFKKEMNKNIKE